MSSAARRYRSSKIYPGKCQRLAVGTGAPGVLPVMEEVKQEAPRRKIELLVLPTTEPIQALQQGSKDTSESAQSLYSTPADCVSSPPAESTKAFTSSKMELVREFCPAMRLGLTEDCQPSALLQKLHELIGG
jgi:hypothetical protein